VGFNLAFKGLKWIFNKQDSRVWHMINVVLETDQWQAFLNIVMNLTGVKNAGNILTSSGNISFSNSQNGFCCNRFIKFSM